MMVVPTTATEKNTIIVAAAYYQRMSSSQGSVNHPDAASNGRVFLTKLAHEEVTIAQSFCVLASSFHQHNEVKILHLACPSFSAGAL